MTLHIQGFDQWVSLIITWLGFFAIGFGIKGFIDEHLKNRRKKK